MSDIKFQDMTSGSFAFLWPKAGQGYEWVNENTHELDSNLVPQGNTPIETIPPWLLSRGKMLQQYPPLAEKTLHRKFATCRDRASVLKFANRYGLLGLPLPLVPKGSGDIVLGESLGRWLTGSQELGIMLAIWDRVKDKEEGKLGQIIVWPTNDSVELKMKAKFDEKMNQWVLLPFGDGKSAMNETLAQHGKTQVQPELLEHWKPYSVIEPAKYYLCREVNKRLKGHVSPRVLPFLKDKICFFPDTLLSAMWLMLFDEITGVLRLRTCDVCGEWKQVLTKRNTCYCSVRCQMVAHRKRHSKKP